jgi:hypothetical protein
MSLSVPLPIKTDVCIMVTVVNMDGSIPVRCGVTVNKMGTFQSIYDWITSEFALPKVIIAEIYNNNIHMYMPPGKRVTDVRVN